MKTELQNMKTNSFITAKLPANFGERSFSSWKVCSHQKTREESGTNFHFTILENF